MKTNLRLAAVLLIAAGACSCATLSEEEGGGATVQLDYEEPERFTDMARSHMNRSGADEGYLETLRRHVERVGFNALPAGSTLAVTITNVDMAGEFEPERGPSFNDIRIIKSIYPPRIDLTYRLTDASGVVLNEGERQLRDMSFDWKLSPVNRDDPLRHEKAMLDDFLRGLARAAR